MIKIVYYIFLTLIFFLNISYGYEKEREKKESLCIDIRKIHELSDEKLLEIEEAISSVRSSKRESSQLSCQLNADCSVIKPLNQFEKRKNQLVLYNGLQKVDESMVLAINFSENDFFKSSIQTFFVTDMVLCPKTTVEKKNLLAESRTFSFGNFYDLKRSRDLIKEMYVPLELYIDFSNNFKAMIKSEKLDFFHKNTIQFSGYVDEQFFRVCARYYILCEEICKTITQLQKREIPSVSQLLHHLDLFDQSSNELLTQIFYVPENIAYFSNGVLHVNAQNRDNHIQKVLNKDTTKILVKMGRSTQLFNNTNVHVEKNVNFLEEEESDDSDVLLKPSSINPFLEEDSFPPEKSKFKDSFKRVVRKIRNRL